MDFQRLLRMLQEEDAIIQPRRLAILILLALEGRRSFRELQKTLSMSSGNLGSHLFVLEREGLVSRTRCLKRMRYVTCYEITDEGMEKLARILEIASKLSDLMERGSER